MIAAKRVWSLFTLLVPHNQHSTMTNIQQLGHKVQLGNSELVIRQLAGLLLEPAEVEALILEIAHADRMDALWWESTDPIHLGGADRSKSNIGRLLGKAAKQFYLPEMMKEVA